MPLRRTSSRFKQARPNSRHTARWFAVMLLLFCALISPTAAFAASPTKPIIAPVSAPRAQGSTFERWVDGIGGSDSDQDSTQCTRAPDEDNEGEYVYHSCRSITKALEYANPGDIIRVVGGIFGVQSQVTYSGQLNINHDLTIIGGYTAGFGNQIDPPRFDSLEAVVSGAVVINGSALLPGIPPSLTGEVAMEVHLESISVTSGGIDIKSDGYTNILLFYPKTVNVTLEDLHVYSVVDGGSGINHIGNTAYGIQNKLTIGKSTISGNTGSTGGGIFVGSGAILDVGAGTIISGNSASGGSGGGIGASNATTITVSGGVTITGNSATNGGGIYASGSVLNIGSDTFIRNNNATSGAGIYLASGTNRVSGATIEGNNASSQGGGIYAAGVPTLTNLEIKQNSAQSGGGVYLNNLNGGTFSSSDVFSNTASSGGGGYYVNGGSGFTLGSLNVQGNGAGTHGGGGYVTNVSNANTSIIQGNSFTGNDANNNGGGLFVINSAITLQSNTFTGNDANSGGGLYLEQSGNAIATGSTFDSNTANYGGGICLDSTNGTKFSSLDLLGNTANQLGGGIYVQDSSSVTIGSANIQGNTSGDKGAGLYVVDSTLTFTSSTFIDGNVATGKGGGGYLDGSSAIVNFQTLDLQDNEASEGGGFYLNQGKLNANSATSFLSNKANGGAGGALYLKGSGGTASTISNLFAQSNEATNGGAFYADGVSLTLGSINLTGNKAANGNGGGAYFNNSTVTFQNAASLIENTAVISGGGIYAAATNLTFQSGATFSGNKAEGGSGGGIYLSTTGSNSASFGVSTFIENVASANGGGLYANLVAVTVNAASNFESNLAQGGSGGGFYINSSTLALGGVTVKSNRAFFSGGGGYFSNANLQVSADTLFDNNSAQGTGGGLAVSSASNVLVDDSLFTNNTGTVDGGALHVTNSPLTVQSGSAFNSNTAISGRGGAIFVSGSNSTLANLTFGRNKATTGGGALYITTGTLSLTNSSFSENEGGALTGTGGGAFLNATSANIANNTFSKNSANSGAGLYLANTPDATLTALQFIENSSTGSGGGLYVNTSTATLTASTIRANQAGSEGGAIHARFSDVDLANILIVGNKVTNVANYATGIYLSNTIFDATHVTIANNLHSQLQGSAHAFYVAPPESGTPAQSSLTLINSILSGQAVGVNLLAGNTASFDSVLWNNDHFNWTGAGTFTVTRSRRGDPRFVAVATNDYHLRRDSSAFDQGIVTTVATDLDGVARTQSLAPDLGAYEHRYANGLYLTTSISPPFIRNGDTLTIQLRVRNQSSNAANSVILRANLPSQLPAPNISQGSCQGNFCETNLGTMAAGADVTVNINAGVNGTALSNGLLTLLTNVTLQTGNFTTSDTSASLLAYLYGCRAELNGNVYHTVQEAVNNASNGQLIRISGVCGDVHQNGGPGQLLSLTKNVTLQGGWNSDFTTFDPTLFPTYLDAAGLGRVVYINGNVAPTLENLILRNGSASALGGGAQGKDVGGGVYVNGGTPHFKNVDISNSQSPDLGAGVYLASPNVIRFQSGSIRNNMAGERGGGLYAHESAPILTGVNIAGNTARGGGGVYLYRSPAQFIDSTPLNPNGTGAPTCRIDTNTSTVMPNYVPGPTGGGLPVLWLAPGGGGGIVLDESAATIRGCAINGNTARVGGGAYIHNSAAFIENSLFTANRAQQPTPTAVLIGPGGVRDGDGGGIVVDNQDPTAITLRGLLLSNNQAVRGSGLLARLGRSGTLTLPHFTINTNSGGSAIFALGQSSLAFVNTIVVANTGGAAIVAQNGSGGEQASVTLDHTLFHPPTQTKMGSSNGGSVTSSTEFTGDPAIKNDGYHLKRISFAYGVGTNAFNFPDRDGNARPIGGQVELGADEYATAITVRYVAVGGAGGVPCTDYRSPCPSLQTALDAANSGDFIKMTGGDYTGVRNDGGRIHHALIAKNVTIEGGYFARTDTNTVTDGIYTLNDWEDPHPVERPTVIDVNDQGRVFFIDSGVAPTLSFLTLRRGNALPLGDGPPGSSGGAGGGVYVDGASPIFKNVLIEDSRALFGSGFYLRNAGGSYTGVTLQENGVNVANARGGAFYIQGGQPTLQSMTIQANIAITGAGIYLDNSNAILIQNIIQSNGNATTLDGGGVYISAGTPNLITNTVATNQAQHGGGLRIDNSNTTLTGNIVNNNCAGTDPAPVGQNNGLGGGLYILGGAPLLTDNTISNNQAIHPLLSYGGGIYVEQTALALNGNTISANQAHRGGGIYFAATTNINVQGNTINNNVAQAPNENLRASGGGVYLASTTISFTTNSLSQNSALHGGALYVAGAGQNRIRLNSFISNITSKDGGAIYLDASDATLQNNMLQSNRTTGGRGGGIFARNGQAMLNSNTLTGNQAALDGGGVFLSNDGTTIQGGLIENGLAGDGAGIYIDGPAPSAAQPAPWINQVEIANNNASNHGGALFIANSGAQITLNTLHDNKAAVDGGGAYLQESTPAAFSGNVIRSNEAGDQGGGLYLTDNSSGRYQSNVIIDNSAFQAGGIYVGGATPTLVHTTLARNGSALVAEVQDGSPTTVVLSNTIVSAHSLGIQGESGTNIALYTTLWHEVAVDLFGSGNLLSNNNISGNPNFLPDGYHIQANSAAADKGIVGSVAMGSDVDNEGRFQGNGPEIGADELTAGCAVIIANSPGVVYNNLQQAVDTVQNGGELHVAGTCTGVQNLGGTPQLAYLTKDVTIRGGFKAGSWDVSNPAAHPTVLDAQKAGRVIRVANDVRVVLANLTLINGSAAGLGGGAGNVDAGGNLFVDMAQITLQRIEVINGSAALGGGLFVRSPIALVSASTFRDNIATASGGAIFLENAPTSVQVSTSTFSNNRAVDGGAIYALGGAPILLGNTFVANQTIGGSGRGGAIYLSGSNANLNRNRMQSNRAVLGGGLLVSGGNPNFTNNILISNVGINDAGALYSINSPLNMRNNTWVGNSTVRNGGSALLFAAPSSSQQLLFSNNIVVNHTLAISVATGNQFSAQATLWHNNQTKWTGAVSETPNFVEQDPLFVNSAAGNYRLQESSPAVDRGINIGVTDDIDGQDRPARQGFDMGADEYLRASVNATLNALPNPVASGATQTYVLQVVNNGDVDVVARVQITLPAVLTPLTSPIWENVTILRGAVWQQSLGATVNAEYTGPLSAIMVVTTNVGATANATASSSAAAISGDILEFSGESLPNPAAPGSNIELWLRIVNRGGIPLKASVRAQLPEGLSASSPLDYSPTIAGPDGIWSTRLNAIVSPDVPLLKENGEFNELATTFIVQTDQGTSHTFDVVTKIANPGIQVSRTPSPRPAISGQQLLYTVRVTNTGNVALATTISNTFPLQVALDDLGHGQPIFITLDPGQDYTLPMTTTVEAGYVGVLEGSVLVKTDQNVGVLLQDELKAQKQQLTPTATAKGGNWHDSASWEPPGVPPASAIVFIPEDVFMFSNLPVSVVGLFNYGTLEMRATLGNSQAMSVTNILENYGEILGRDGVGAGQVGLTLNLNSAILYNEGTICAGDGAPDGGAGGDLIIIAGSTTNKGIFCAGHGADVNNPNANIPGGEGGEVLLAFDPGLFTNTGQVLGGNGGNSHANFVPPQPGGKGGDVTIVAAAAARVRNSDIRGGSGGRGSNGAADGVIGQVIIGAPIIDSEGTRFGSGNVLLFDQSSNAYNFAAVGPDLVTASPVTGVAIFSIRIFNRGARTDTFVASPLTTPTGWTVNNLPSTITVRPFRSSLFFVVLALPTGQVAAAIDQSFRVVISSQNDAGNQVVVPLRVVTGNQGYRLQLPRINR